MTYYVSIRLVDGKPRKVIVDETGKIVNRSPSKDEMKNLQAEVYKRNVYKEYTDKELLNFLKTFYEENGRVPVLRDFVNNSGYPCYNTYREHFGSWDNALKMSGMIYERKKIYTDDELLNYLKIFYEENRRIPVTTDFKNNPAYPGSATYLRHFGSWSNALKLVGMDRDTMVEQGNLETTHRRSRWFEIMVIGHFENIPIDLSGDNCNSPFDGICPNGQTYEVKSSKLHKYVTFGGYWSFATRNRDKEEDKEAIQWYYFGAFDEDHAKLLYVWRVPGEIVEKASFYVGMYGGKFNIENMKEYDITDKFKKMIDDENKTKGNKEIL